ncbi:MAG: leucine-rich repeat protein [Anaeroplasmataceae bacterium]
MKNRKLIILIFMFVLFVLAGCDDVNHNHSYSDSWDYDSENHYHSCACGDKIDITKHSFNEVLTKEASCSEKGKKTYTCLCGYSYDEEIDTLEHVYKNGVCEKCGEIQCSIGLEYQLLSDNTYEVVGLGTCTDDRIVIPNTYNGLPVTSIKDKAFNPYWPLLSITIFSNMKNIGTAVFTGCYKLVEIYNLSSLDITIGSSDYGLIGKYARVIHTSLEEESVIKMTDDGYVYMFDSGEYHLLGYKGNETKLVLPYDINGMDYNIFEGAFRHYETITSVVIPDAVKSIGRYSFQHCYKLVEVYNLSSIEMEIGSTMGGCTAFYARVLFSSITEQSDQFVTEDGYKFIYVDDKYYLIDYLGNETKLKLPDKINGADYEINSGAFLGLDFITNIEIPSSVTKVGARAFNKCSSLESIEIPSSVTGIEAGILYGCTSLETVILPYFTDRPDTSKDDNYQFPLGFLFGDLKCKDSYETIQYFYKTNLNNKSQTTYYIPKSLKTVVIKSGNILSGALSNCIGINSIIIGKDVISIDSEAFIGCSNLSLYYEGTVSEWDYIDTTLTDMNIYYYSETKPNNSGNYWHYDNDKNIVLW